MKIFKKMLMICKLKFFQKLFHTFFSYVIMNKLVNDSFVSYTTLPNYNKIKGHVDEAGEASITTRKQRRPVEQIIHSYDPCSISSLYKGSWR